MKNLRCDTAPHASASGLRHALAAGGLALLAALAATTAGAGERAGAVYVLDNQPAPAGNAILVYARAADGTLTPSGSVATGGNGYFVANGSNPVPDPLGSQHALVHSHGLLLAVNAGSNDISVFDADGTHLQLVDREPSGGIEPVSIAVHGLLVYVLNSAANTAGALPNISGFVIDPIRHRLVPLPNSQRPLAGGAKAAPAQVSFADGGDVLMVTEKGTQTIDTYAVNRYGYATAPVAHPSSGAVPFGFAITRRGDAIVSEAGAAAASSYDIDRDGSLSLLSASVALTGQKAPCWLEATHDGRYAYTANAGTGTISSLGIAPDGALTLLSASAASGVAIPLDMALSHGGPYLYVRGGTGTVNGFRIESDGSLTPVNAAAGIPNGAQGIAAD